MLCQQSWKRDKSYCDPRMPAGCVPRAGLCHTQAGQLWLKIKKKKNHWYILTNDCYCRRRSEGLCIWDGKALILLKSDSGTVTSILLSKNFREIFSCHLQRLFCGFIKQKSSSSFHCVLCIQKVGIIKSNSFHALN